MISDYEAQRLENIRRNQEILQELGVEQSKKDFRAAVDVLKPKKVIKGTSIHKRKAAKKEAPPPRKSPRLLGMEAEGVVSSKLGFHVKATSKPEEPRPEPRKPKLGRLDLESTLSSGSSSGVLKSLTGWADEEGVVHDFPVTAISKLSIADHDAAKVVPNRIYSQEIHPSAQKLVVFVGDKSGRIGVWDVDEPEDAAAIVNFEPHTSPVVDLLVHPTNWSKIFSCSYDGSVRCLDLEKSVFHEVTRQPEGQMGLGTTNDGACLLVSDDSGQVRTLDTRTSKVVETHRLHARKIYSVKLNPLHQHLVVTASLDGSVCVWDRRKLKGPTSALASSEHSMAVTQAVFSPDGSRLLAIANDNYLHHWSNVPKDLMNSYAKIRHRTITGRWVSNLRASWNPHDHDTYVVGDCDRTIDIVNAAANRVVAAIADEHLGSIPALNQFHPQRENVVVSANASGKVYVWR